MLLASLLIAGWIGTWAAAPQAAVPGKAAHYANQTLRLVVHTSAAGTRARVRLSNLFGTGPLAIGAATIARRAGDASIEAASIRPLTFGGAPSATVPPGASVTSDPVDLEVPALSDLAVSLFLPDAVASTTHVLAQQHSYVCEGNAAPAASCAVVKRIASWPFLTGVDVLAPEGAFSIVAFGDSLIDGDGSTPDRNARWTDALARRVHEGVLNQGLIGNRLLRDSPPELPFGPSGLSRFERDALDQPGVRVVIVRIGVNDIALPGSFAPETDRATAAALIDGYRRLISLAHAKGIRMVGTTATPFEGATLAPTFWSPEKEALREQVNAWLRAAREFDAVIDIEPLVRDPSRPSRLSPKYDSGDHLHPNDAGYDALGSSVITSPDAIFGKK